MRVFASKRLERIHQFCLYHPTMFATHAKSKMNFLPLFPLSLRFFFFFSNDEEKFIRFCVLIRHDMSVSQIRFLSTRNYLVHRNRSASSHDRISLRIYNICIRYALVSMGIKYFFFRIFFLYTLVLHIFIYIFSCIYIYMYNNGQH